MIGFMICESPRSPEGPKENMNSAEDHGHREEFKIIVNGRQKVVTAKELSCDEVVALAFNPLSRGAHTERATTRRLEREQTVGRNISEER